MNTIKAIEQNRTLVSIIGLGYTESYWVVLGVSRRFVRMDVLSGRRFVRTALDVLSGRRFVRTALDVLSGRTCLRRFVRKTFCQDRLRRFVRKTFCQDRITGGHILGIS